MNIGIFELTGKERENALKHCKEAFNSWGLTMPEVQPYPLHFGLNNFKEIGEIELDINNNVEEGYCGKFIFVTEGQTCPFHFHRIKHETFYLVKGKMELETDNDLFMMKQGDIYIMDRNVKHRFTGVEDSLVLECSKPDIITDSIFVDERINSAIKAYAKEIEEG